MISIAAHQIGTEEKNLKYSAGNVLSDCGVRFHGMKLSKSRTASSFTPWDGPGLASFDIMQVPTGDALPVNGKVQMYPCYSFEFHLVLLAFDPVIGRPEIHLYAVGHDCGTVINPAIVSGMTYGGIAHGIGAALFEEFAYDSGGQLLTQSFLDYLMPSSQEVPDIQIIKHCTPSPHTVFGQKGSGESGYLGAPAAISSAINDAVRLLGIHFEKLPIRMSTISDAVASKRS